MTPDDYESLLDHSDGEFERDVAKAHAVCQKALAAAKARYWERNSKIQARWLAANGPPVSTARDTTKRFKPAKPHNSLLAPGVCLCVECSKFMLTRRCPVKSRQGQQCGDYRDHAGEHTLLVDTTFLIAAERAAS